MVVRLSPTESEAWSDADVLKRWTALFKGPLLIRQAASGAPLSEIEESSLRSILAVYRKRLASLSWFMKCLNEPIARKANIEDGCTRHFWESRFRSQALRSERALLTAMAYVDLNPIRAKMAETPEDSSFTSVWARIAHDDLRASEAIARLHAVGELRHTEFSARDLLPFAQRSSQSKTRSIELPMYEHEYLKLVDQTGRIVVRGKRGHIDRQLSPILERLGVTDNNWLIGATEFEAHYRNGDLKLKRTA